MNTCYTFNYIITIHNKENLIESVLINLIECVSPHNNIYLVLDGCTDKTEEIVDKIINKFPNNRFTKVLTDDVHELKSINSALRIAEQDGDGFNIVLQDDILLKEKELENKVIALYEWSNNILGIVSFRHGANLSRSLLLETNPVLPFMDYIESIYGHQKHNLAPLRANEFVFREIAIKSPICVPFYVVRNIGIPDERFAPWDDLNYCYKVLLQGYRNGVFSLNFESEPEWGSMRTKTQKLSHSSIVEKNVALFKVDNPEVIQGNPIYKRPVYLLNIESNTIKRKLGRELFHSLINLIKPK